MSRPTGLAAMLKAPAIGSGASMLNTKGVRLVESCAADPQRIDRAAGVIRGVRVLGKVSKNGREYSDQAMRDAVRLYEGADVFVNHPDRSKPNSERSLRDKFGFLKNARIEGDAVRADLHFIKAHPEAGFVLEMAERNPRMFGLSHNAEGRMGKRGGKMIVEGLESVRSVDLVSNPATNAGLFESVRLREEDAMAPLATTDEPGSGKAFSRSWQAVREGFATDAANVVLSDSMTRKEKERKLLELLDAYEAAEEALNKAEKVNTESGSVEGFETIQKYPGTASTETIRKLKMKESFSGSGFVAGRFSSLDSMTPDGRFSRDINHDREKDLLRTFGGDGARVAQELTESEKREAEKAEADRLSAFVRAAKR